MQDPLERIYLSGGGCLSGESLIWTPGGYVEIKDIEVGQEVFCFTPDRKIVISTVERTSVHPSMETHLYKFWGGEIRATPNHAFYTEHGSFKEIQKWAIDDFFIDYRFEYRPLLEVCDRKFIDVYNFEVQGWHTYIIGEHGILSSNGGGGKNKGGSPTEQADSSKSSARANVVAILSEGKIEGLLKGDQSILLDRTPVGNADGTKNFEGFKHEIRLGEQNQELLWDTVEEGLTSETEVGTEVKQALPVTRTFINSQVTSVRVRLGFQMQKYEDDGDIVGTNLHYRIYLKQGSAGAFNIVYEENRQNQKFSSLTEFEYQFGLDTQGGAVDEFSIRVERVTPDSTESSEVSVLRFQSFTEIVSGAKLNYANTAVIALEFLAEQFSSVPQIAYEIGGRTVAIPTNAVVNPDDRGLDYSEAIWDGTLYEPAIACSDPAWQIYDILTNDRYGLGRQIKACQVSSYDLYEISKYNNELIADGFGGTERRFRCNTVLQTKQQAHEFLDAFLASCRAHYYWDGSCIRFWQDKPGEVIRQFTNSDVEDGKFSYSSTDIQTRNSVANVTWNDPDDYYRTTVEPVEFQPALTKYGWRDDEFTDYGCTSRGQAYRAGRFALMSGFYNTETVSFKGRLTAIYARPGDIIAIADWRRASKRYGGLIEKATTTSITLDSEVELPAATGYQITCTMPDLTIETKPISNGVGTHKIITVSEAFSAVPLNGSNWIVDVIKPRYYRVQSLKAENENLNLIEVAAGAYREDLYNAVETGWILEPKIEEETAPIIPPVPQNISVSFRQLSAAADTDYAMTASWTSPSVYVVGYQYRWKRGLGGTWSDVSSTNATEFIVSPVNSGSYYVQVASILLNGGVSAWSEQVGGLAGVDYNFYFNFTRPQALLVL
jgi:predicted phage tail protein